MDQKEVISAAMSPATAISKHVIELLSLVKDGLLKSAQDKLNYTRGYVASLYEFNLIGEELFNIISNQLLQSEAKIDAMELEQNNA
jgi:hypothetical protein